MRQVIACSFAIPLVAIVTTQAIAQNADPFGRQPVKHSQPPPGFPLKHLADTGLAWTPEAGEPFTELQWLRKSLAWPNKPKRIAALQTRSFWSDIPASGPFITSGTNIELAIETPDQRVSRYRTTRGWIDRRQNETNSLFRIHPQIAAIGGGVHYGGPPAAVFRHGKLVGATTTELRTVRSYWLMNSPPGQPRFEYRVVMEHDPARSYVPFRASWYGLYPGEALITWRDFAGQYLPSRIESISTTANRYETKKDASGDSYYQLMSDREHHSITLIDWKFGDDVPADFAELYDPNLYPSAPDLEE